MSVRAPAAAHCSDPPPEYPGISPTTPNLDDPPPVYPGISSSVPHAESVDVHGGSLGSPAHIVPEYGPPGYNSPDCDMPDEVEYEKRLPTSRQLRLPIVANQGHLESLDSEASQSSRAGKGFEWAIVIVFVYMIGGLIIAAVFTVLVVFFRYYGYVDRLRWRRHYEITNTL